MVYFYRQKMILKKKGASGIRNTGIAGKWCKRGAELEHLFAIVRKRYEDIEKKKQGKKYSSQICFISILEKFNKYYYRLTEMESFSLTLYVKLVVSYSNYPDCSVSNQLPIKKKSNTNKKNLHRKFPLRTRLQKNCSKIFKQIIAHIIIFQIGFTTKLMLFLKKVALKST